MTDAAGMAPEFRGAGAVTDVDRLADRAGRAWAADIKGFVVAMVIGAAAAWHERFLVGADAMSYLDYSDRFLDGTWLTNPNGYWSPGYPFLLAVLRRVFGSGPSFDASALRIAGFLGYVAAAVGMLWLLRELRRARPDETGGARWGDADSLALSVLGWGLFIWAAGDLTGPAHSTPDTWVSGTTFLATAAAVAVIRRERWVDTIALGVILGVGYLFKTVMLPTGVMLLVTLAVLERFGHRSLKRVAIATVVFVAICAPRLVTVSRLAGKPTIGQVGMLVHEWYVGDTPCPLFSEPVRGDEWDTCMMPTKSGETLSEQPFPRLTTKPSIYFFPQPARATFPAWYDATRWYRDVKPTIHVKTQIITVVKNLATDWVILIPFIATAIGLVLSLGGRVERWRETEWLLLIPALGTFVMYAASYTDKRYLGPSAALTILAFAPVAVTATRQRIGTVFLGNALIAPTLLLLASFLGLLSDELWFDRHATNKTLAQAQGLIDAGLAPGSRVGIIGDGSNAYWARLDRVHIIAEIHSVERNQFWMNTPERQTQLLDAFRKAGVAAIVGDPSPGGDLPAGWTTIKAERPLALYKF